MSRSIVAIGVLLVSAMGCCGQVMASDPPTPAPQHPTQGPSTSSQQGSIDGFGAPVSASTLNRYSGGTLITNRQAINGTVSNDSAAQVVTGNNAITGDAFSSAAGIPSVIQNTGNNVLIQNGVIVNVEMKQ